jgi:para-nitrobenzyl esterase
MRGVVRQTQSGAVRGFSRNGVNVFRGIPYGGAPSGKHRFAPPVPRDRWLDTRSSLFYGPISPQCPSTAGSIGTGSDEYDFLFAGGSNGCAQSDDCLRLNIWAPQHPGPHPVMVFLHGGAFVGGSGNDLLAYDGTSLAGREEVVVVTVNHRLNAFGFLDLASFGAAGFEDHVNVGMQDLVLALEWISANVGAFGGDSEAVTLFGQSGGAMKIAALMSMPSAQGLFHRAILQSGSMYDLLTREESNALTRAFLDEIDVDPFNLTTLHCVSLDRLVKAVRDLDALWAPTVDGKIITEPLLGDPSAPQKPMSAGIPIIVGSTQHEFVNAVDREGGTAMTEAALREEAIKVFGSRADAVIAAYRDEYPDECTFNLHATISAWWMRELCLRQARAKRAQGGRAYNYVFAWKAPVLTGDLATYHGCELAYVFNNAELCESQTGGTTTAYGVARAMSGAWAAFARTGDPATGQIPKWPEWNQSESTFVFDAPCRVVRHLDSTALKLAAGTPVPGLHGVR